MLSLLGEHSLQHANRSLLHLIGVDILYHWDKMDKFVYMIYLMWKRKLEQLNPFDKRHFFQIYYNKALMRAFSIYPLLSFGLPLEIGASIILYSSMFKSNKELMSFIGWGMSNITSDRGWEHK